jgi:N-acetylneuraminate lyase
MMEPLGLKGLVAAAVTPMDENGDVDLRLVPRIVDHLESHQVSGLYIAGSTGEGMSLSREERKAVAEAYVEAARGRLRTLVQVGHNSLKESAELAAHAERIGADAVSATPPGYFKPSGEKGLVESMLPLVEAAPDTRFYYYHIPFLSGIQIDPMRFTDLALDRLSTFCGIKYSDGGTMYNLPLLQKAGPGLEFLGGSDEAYLQALALGYDAAVGSTYNFAAPIYQRVRQAFEAGDMEEARLWQGRALQMIEVMFSTCGRSSLKAMMGMVNLDCGSVRRPLEPATGEQVAELRRRLSEIGWFDWVGQEVTMPAR